MTTQNNESTTRTFYEAQIRCGTMTSFENWGRVRLSLSDIIELVHEADPYNLPQERGLDVILFETRQEAVTYINQQEKLFSYGDRVRIGNELRYECALVEEGQYEWNEDEQEWECVETINFTENDIIARNWDARRAY